MAKAKAAVKKTPRVGYIMVRVREYENYLQKTKEEAVEEYCDDAGMCDEDIEFGGFVLLHVTHKEDIEYVAPKRATVFKFSNKKAV